MERSAGREILDGYRIAIIYQVHTSTGGKYGGTTITSVTLIVKPPRIPLTYCCIIIFGSPTICTWTYPLSSPGYACIPPVCLMAKSLMNQGANVKSRRLNYWNSVSTVQLFELTPDVLEIILQKTSTSERQPRERRNHTRGLLRQSRGAGRGGFGPRGDPHRKLARQRLTSLRKAEEPSPSSSCNFVAVFIAISNF